MKPFTYSRATSVADALRLLAQPGAQIIAGGADLMPLLNDNLATPGILVDISRIPELNTITYSATDGLRLGATATLNAVRQHPSLEGAYAVLRQAIQESASPQVRNLATIGGNLLQMPRCSYYRDGGFPCLRRDGGDLCAALVGDTSHHALVGFGAPDPHHACVAVNPSDSANALAALDAAVELRSLAGIRSVPVAEFFYTPSANPRRATVIEPNEIITAITIPPPAPNSRGTYIKLRDRAAYEFALVSAAAVIAVDGATISHARIALGGIAWGPYRALQAEAYLLGKPLTEEHCTEAARLALMGAQPLPDNAYKIPMAQAAVRRAIQGEVYAPQLMEARA